MPAVEDMGVRHRRFHNLDAAKGLGSFGIRLSSPEVVSKEYGREMLKKSASGVPWLRPDMVALL